MPTAHAVATELRKLADSLDKQPKTVIVKPHLFFSNSEKNPFLAIAQLLPRPIVKGDGSRHEYVTLEYNSDALWIRAQIAKDKTCVLVKPAQPAVYECDLILSQIEESSLEVA